MDNEIELAGPAAAVGEAQQSETLWEKLYD